MTQSRDPWTRGPSPSPRDRLRTWLTIGAPVLALIAVVAFGVFGRAAAPAMTPSPAAALAADNATAIGAASSTGPVAAPSDPPAEPTAGFEGRCEPASIPFDPAGNVDLTGTWLADDGGVYYVRQLDDVVWWNGMSSRDGPPDGLGQDWNNVGRGVLNDDLTITADWADVPRGQARGRGTIDFQVQGDASGQIQIVKVRGTGSGRGDSVWTRCTLGFAG
jgi:hypothetical protein